MYEHRSDETGRWLRTEFCPVCGTPVTHTTELRPGEGVEVYEKGSAGATPLRR